MEQRCPHCGFLQPKDEFCAVCGINIDKYRKKRSFLRKRRLIFFSLLSFVVIFVSFLYFSFFSSQKKVKNSVIGQNVGSNKSLENSRKGSVSQKGAGKRDSDVSSQGEKLRGSVGGNLKENVKTASLQIKNQKLNKTPLNTKGVKEKNKQAPSKTEDKTSFRSLFAEIPKESVIELFEKEEVLSDRALLVEKKKSLSQWIQTLQGRVLPGGGVKKVLAPQRVNLNFTSFNKSINQGQEGESVEDSRRGLRVGISLNWEEKKQRVLSKVVEIKTEGLFEYDQDGFNGQFTWPIQKILFLLGDFPRNDSSGEEIQGVQEGENATTESGVRPVERTGFSDRGEEDSNFFETSSAIVDSFDGLNENSEVVLILQFE